MPKRQHRPPKPPSSSRAGGIVALFGLILLVAPAALTAASQSDRLRCRAEAPAPESWDVDRLTSLVGTLAQTRAEERACVLQRNGLTESSWEELTTQLQQDRSLALLQARARGR